MIRFSDSWERGLSKAPARTDPCVNGTGSLWVLALPSPQEGRCNQGARRDGRAARFRVSLMTEQQLARPLGSLIPDASAHG